MNGERYTIDRFEGAFAVCEKDGKTFSNIKREKLPDGVKSGDSILILDDGDIIKLNNNARRNLIRSKMSRAFE